jgi:hydroxylamine reductase (hybrid-cluster protein)
MENHIFISYTKNDFKEIIQQAIAEYEKKKNPDSTSSKNFSISKVAQMLGRSTQTIQKLVKIGELKTTSDGRRITHQALQDYLKDGSK